MKFKGFKRFIGKSLEDISSWLQNELNSVMRELYIGLNSLTFSENFTSYTWQGTLSASEEKKISHPLGVVPAGYLIFKQIGNAIVDAGTTPWTNKVLYLRNNSGSNSVELTVIIFV